MRLLTQPTKSNKLNLRPFAVYKQWLKAEAEHFGLKPEDVEGMEHPMLVRVRDEDDTNTDRPQFAREANQSMNMGNSPAQLAFNDANSISEKMLKSYQPDEDGEVLTEENEEFIDAFYKMIGDNEAASLRESDGTPNRKGVERIQNAVFAKIYNSSVLTTFMAESAKPQVKKVIAALNNCVPDFAQIRGHDDLDVVPDMMESIEYILSHQNETKAELEHKLRNQGALGFTDDTPKFQTDHAVDMILAVSDRMGDRNKLKNIFKAISDGIKTEVASRENPEVDMFSGPAQPKTKEQVVKEALDKVHSGNDIQKSLKAGVWLLRKSIVPIHGYVKHSGKLVSNYSQKSSRINLATGSQYPAGLYILKKSHIGGEHGRDDRRREVRPQIGTLKKSDSAGRRDGQEGRSESGISKSEGTGSKGQQAAGNRSREGSRQEEGGSGRRAGAWLIKSHVRATSFVNERGTRINRRDYNDKRTRKTDSRQLGFDFDFRPGTSDSDKANSISLGKRTTAMFLRRCGGTVLANAVCEEVTKRGTVSLIGQRVTSPKELATLAQVFRNPNYETLRYFFTKGDEIVGQTGVSSMLPHCALAFPTGHTTEAGMDWLTKQIDACGADGYFLMHNHPSGNVEASKEDINLSTELAKTISAKFKGHLIINHDKYNWINKDMHTHITGDSTLNNKQDYNAKPSLPHALIGRRIGNQQDMVNLAQELKAKDGYMVVFGQRGQSGISGIMEIPMDTKPKKLAVALKNFALQTSGSQMALYVPAGLTQEQREWAHRAVYEDKYLSLILTKEGEEMYSERGFHKFCGQYTKGHVVDAHNDRIQKAGTWLNIRQAAEYLIKSGMSRITLRKSQMSLFAHHEELRPVHAGERRLASGAVTQVQQYQRRTQVADHPSLFAKKPINPIPGSINPLNLTEAQLGFVPRPNFSNDIPGEQMQDLERRYMAQTPEMMRRALDYQRGTWRPDPAEMSKREAEHRRNNRGTHTQLRSQVEQMASEQGKTLIEIMSTMQSAAVRSGDEWTVTRLGDLKFEYRQKMEAERRKEREEKRKEASDLNSKIDKQKDWKAKNTVGANITEYVIYNIPHIEAVFGVPIEAVKNLAATMVADYGGSVTFKVTIVGGRTAARIGFIGSDRTSISREFTRSSNGKIDVYHAYFRAQTPGTGSGKALFRTSMGAYKALGIREVTVSANCDVGGYAWARFGYKPVNWYSFKDTINRNLNRLEAGTHTVAVTREGSSSDDRETINYPKLPKRIADKIREKLKSDDPYKLWEISDMKAGDRNVGKELLLNTSWSGKIALNDTKAMRRLKQYVNS